MTDDSTERRTAVRYRMKAPTIFQWKSLGSDRLQGEGATRDISVAGVFVFTAACPPVNSTIQMEVILPPLRTALNTRIKAEMKVLRVEHDLVEGGRSGFSAVGKGFSLRPVVKQS
jgi:hypothetical protein